MGFMAIAVGFEPTDDFSPPVFKTGAFNQTQPRYHLYSPKRGDFLLRIFLLHTFIRCFCTI